MMKGVRNTVLILAAGPLCRNPRVQKEAAALSEAGLDVTVTSIVQGEKFEEYDRELMLGSRYRKISIDRTDGGIRASFVSFVERATTWAGRRMAPIGIEIRSSLGPYLALARLADQIPANLTIVHTELPFVVGCQLLKRGRKVAADFEDWHSRDLLDEARAARPLRMLRRAEKFLMTHSVYVSAPSDSMASALQAAYGGARPVNIPNTFPLQPWPGKAERKAVPSFFWFSQTIGPGRGLEAFIAAWSLTERPSRLCLLGDVDAAYRDMLVGSVPERRRSDIVFLPIVSPVELPGIIAEHDIGLALEPESPESRNLTSTNKIFQYMNAGLAILATPTAGQMEVLSRVPGCGVIIALDSKNSMASTLDEILESPNRIAEMGAAARMGAENVYCWEISSRDLISCVRHALNITS